MWIFFTNLSVLNLFNRHYEQKRVTHWAANGNNP